MREQRGEGVLTDPIGRVACLPIRLAETRCLRLTIGTTLELRGGRLALDHAYSPFRGYGVCSLLVAILGVCLRAACVQPCFSFVVKREGGQVPEGMLSHCTVGLFPRRF